MVRPSTMNDRGESETLRGRCRWLRLAVGIGLALAVLLAHAPLLPRFVAILGLDGPLHATDAYTHYLRAELARSHYLASGHRWGWDPYWWQGYIPFLRYSHLSYCVIAAVAAITATPTYFWFNLYVVGTFLGAPLLGGLSMVRWGAGMGALVGTLWLASLYSPYGGGLWSTFGIGLITQQAGLCVFVLFATALMLGKRLELAALLLGIGFLVHVHTGLVGAYLWATVGLFVAAERRGWRAGLGDWLLASMLAFAIASPQLLGIWYARDHDTSFTGFGAADAISMLQRGVLGAPWQNLLATGLAVSVLPFLVRGRPARRTVAAAILAGAGLWALSLQRWEVGVPVVDQALRYVLRLRSISFAFAWQAVVAVAAWPKMGPRLRTATVVLTCLGAGVTLAKDANMAGQIGGRYSHGRGAAGVQARLFGELVHELRERVDAEVATLSLQGARRPGTIHPRQRLLDEIRLPMMGGHGLELPVVRHDDEMMKLPSNPCWSVRDRLARHAIGYIIGADPVRRTRLQDCLPDAESWAVGEWWVIDTGIRWSNFSETVSGFDHDETWTELRWTLERPAPARRLLLPMAYVPAWKAAVDGRHAELRPGRGGLAEAVLPAGAKELVLRYEGFRGEWSSVAVAAVAAALLLVLARRRRKGSDPAAGA